MMGLLDKDFDAAVNDYMHRDPARHREDRLQDGHLHHPVLPVAPRSSRPSASARTWWIEYFTNTVTRVGGIGLKEIEEIVESEPQPGL